MYFIHKHLQYNTGRGRIENGMHNTSVPDIMAHLTLTLEIVTKINTQVTPDLTSNKLVSTEDAFLAIKSQ